MAHQFSLPIRGSSSKPKGLMSGATAQYTPAQVEGSTPNQAIPSNIAQAPPPIIDLSHDKKAWDTIIVCSLLSGLFRGHMSPAAIAKAINVRDQRTTAPIGANTVDHMLEIAKSPRTQELYPETCGYKKWEGARDRLAAGDELGDGDDKEAFSLFFDTLQIVNSISWGG